MSLDPLAGLTDDQLFNVQLMLFLNCGRSKSIFKEKRREILCAFNQILNDYAHSRGAPVPTAPYHPGDLKS